MFINTLTLDEKEWIYFFEKNILLATNLPAGRQVTQIKNKINRRGGEAQRAETLRLRASAVKKTKHN